MLKAIFKLKEIKHEESYTEVTAFETTPLPFTRMGILRSEIPWLGNCKIQGNTTEKNHLPATATTITELNVKDGQKLNFYSPMS